MACERPFQTGANLRTPTLSINPTQMEGAAMPRLPDDALAAEAQIDPEAPAAVKADGEPGGPDGSGTSASKQAEPEESAPREAKAVVEPDHEPYKDDSDLGVGAFLQVSQTSSIGDARVVIDELETSRPPPVKVPSVAKRRKGGGAGGGDGGRGGGGGKGDVGSKLGGEDTCASSLKSQSMTVTLRSGMSSSGASGLLTSVAAQTEAERVRRAEQRVRRRNALTDRARANDRANREEEARLLASDAQSARTQKVRRRMMEARELREERAAREPPTHGPGSIPMRGALFSISSSPPVLLNESRGPPRPSTSTGGLPLPPPGLDVKNVQPGLLTTSASLACLARYPSTWRPERLSSRCSMRPHTESVEPSPSLPALLPPFRRMPLDPDDPTAQIMGEIQAARQTPMEPGSRNRRRERSLPRLPQNNLKGFDIPTYELQPMFGTDKRAVPYW